MQNQRRFISENLSQVMDLCRWVAALLVVLTHVNNRMLTPLASLVNPGVFEYLWGFLCGFAHHAVMIFFVLSGYLVGGKVIIERHNFRFLPYLLDRVIRIHLVLLPVLLITYALDNIGKSLDVADIYPRDISERLTWVVFLGNVFSLQNFLVEEFGTNGPLWTLANEFWYYFAFPLLIAPILPYSALSRAAMFACGATLTVGLTALSPEHGVGFLVWATGAIAATITRWRPSAVASAGFFVVLVVSLRLLVRGESYNIYGRMITDVLIGISFAVLLIAVNGSKSTIRVPAVSKRLAGFSYSLYAVHVPVITIYCALLYRETGFGWSSRALHLWHAIAVAGAVAISLLAAFFLHLVTEQQTGRVRSFLRKRATVASAASL